MQQKRIFAFILASFGLFYLGSASAVIISLQPSSSVVNVNDTFSVDIVADGSDLFGDGSLGFGLAPSIGAFDLTLAFDPAVVSPGLVTIGDPIFGSELDVFNLGFNPSDADELVPGSLDIFEVSLDSVADLNDFQPDVFTLASVEFLAQGPGVSPLTLPLIILSDAAGDSLPVQVIESRVQVLGAPQVIPVPAAVWLFATGVLGLIGFGKRRKTVQG